MTATEKLRRLLDERGEYYQTSGDRTWWGRPIDAQTGEPINVFHNQAQPMGEDRLLVELQLATPEQAVAATLGPGTCHAVFEVDAMSEDERIGEYVCSECGETFNDGHGEFPRYCPNCGRKVVND